MEQVTINPKVAKWWNRLHPVTRRQVVADMIDSLEEKENPYEPYRFDPASYIKTFLGWEPWAGQQQVIEAYVLALRQQYERDAWEKGELPLDDLEHWQPGDMIQNRVRIESGHTVGKTKLLAGLVSHFFDCFAPSIIYCFAPGYDQINDLLFKEIRTDREGKGLPGQVLKSPDIRHKGNHFVKGKATSDAKGKGTERVHGQHHSRQCFVLDEAEGIPDFVWNAVDSMTSGGISIVLMAANPRTRTSRFYKARSEPNVKSFRISCLDHPNVVEDKEVIPGAVRRDYVVDMLKHCEVVDRHDPDAHTFELPWQPGVIYKPNAEYLFRVLGIAPANLSDNTFCPTGRYEAATKRPESLVKDDPTRARIGVDVARYGNDLGTIYLRHNGTVRRVCEIAQQDGYEYYIKVKELCLSLITQGVKDIQVRVDGGGGYGSTCIDNLRRDTELNERPSGEYPNRLEKFQVIEVLHNATPCTPESFYNLVTELYYCGGEALKELRLINPPQNLETDLTERTYKHVIDGSRDVKRLTSKEEFKDRFKRSPDDGDGFVYAVAPDYLFGSGEQIPASEAASRWIKNTHQEAQADSSRWTNGGGRGSRWRR